MREAIGFPSWGVEPTENTGVRMALAQLLEKGSDADLLREMVGYVAQRLMGLDTTRLCATDADARW